MSETSPPHVGGMRRRRGASSISAGARSFAIGQGLRGLLLATPPLAVVAVFIGLPVVAAIAYTFGHGGGPNSVIASLAQNQYLVRSGPGTLAAYRDVFQNASFRRDLWVTVVITVSSVVVVLAVSWSVALYARLAESRTSKVLTALAVVPLFVPVVIGSYAILTFYAADGFLRTSFVMFGLGDGPVLSYSMYGVLIGQIWVSMPFGVLILSSGLSGVPNSLIEASRDCGASMMRTVISVLVPLNAIPIIIVATFTGIGVIGSFTVPYLVGPSSPNMLGPTMTNYFQAFNQAQQATVMAVVVFVLAAGIGAAYVWANLRSAKQSGAL